MSTFREWLEKYGPIPDDAGKEIIKQVKKITGLKFAKQRGEYVSGDYETSVRFGIFVMQNHVRQEIPNFDKVLAYIKTKFGDVHVKGRDYINARGYGVPYQDEPEGSIDVKSGLVPLPDMKSFTDSQIQMKQTTDKVLSVVRDLLSSREAKVTGNPKGLQLVRKISITENLVKHKGTLYVMSLYTPYQVMDEKDAENLVKFINLRMSILRDAEVRSWQNDDMSNPYGGRLK